MKVLKASTQNKVRKLIASFDKKIDATTQAHLVKGRKISAKKVQDLAQEIQALYAGLKKLSTASKKSFLAAVEDDQYLATLEDIAKVATKLDLMADLINDDEAQQDPSDDEVITTEDILNEIQSTDEDTSIDTTADMNSDVEDDTDDVEDDTDDVEDDTDDVEDDTDDVEDDVTADMDDDALVEDSSENDDVTADMDDDALVEDSSENDDIDDVDVPMVDQTATKKQARRVTVKKQTASRKVTKKTNGLAGAKLFSFIK
jgi:uncharacterized phage infection (PIP) family protein YhgE